MSDIHKRALEAIFGTIDDDTWSQVASGEILPPLPLPEVADAVGLASTRVDHLIWSEERGRWWNPASQGYTNSIVTAGRYPRSVAKRIVHDANYGSTFNEIAIPVPAGLDALIQRAAGQATRE